MKLESLYAKLPIGLQNWAIGLEYRRLQRRRFDAAFQALWREASARSFWSREQIIAYRDQQLAEFVQHAAQHVPYYRELFQRLKIRAGDIHSIEDLHVLPLLAKRDVQASTRQFQAELSSGVRLITSHTSGTTGGGLNFPVTLDAHRKQWATWWRFREWHGLTMETPCLYFGGRVVVPASQARPPFWRYNRPGRQVLFSGYHLGPDTAVCYLDEIERSGAPWIHGYPSMIALLASFALSLGRRPANIRWITLGSESLTAHQADVIQRAFGVVPVQHYGMAEGVANISLCPQGKLHVDEDFAAVEFIPLGGDQYSVVGTNFSNPAFPLLRYEVDDVATITGQTCDCGRPGRVVDDIDGRKEDYVITKIGIRVGRMDHVFKHLVNIREAQILQIRQGEMMVLVVKGPQYSSADERLLRAEVDKHVGDQVDFDIRYVDQLPRTAGGKLRLVISELSEGALDAVP